MRTAATLDGMPPEGAPAPKSSADVMIDPVVGSRRGSNYLCVVACCAACCVSRAPLTRSARASWASIVTGGAAGFLITGVSAYVHHNLCAFGVSCFFVLARFRMRTRTRSRAHATSRRARLFFLDASEIQFFPQGLVRSLSNHPGAPMCSY
jgi:hypothetical protein